MHALIYETLATGFERDRLAAASTARTGRALGLPRTRKRRRRRFALRIAVLRLRPR
jgi:hypothetical protein